MIRTSVLLFLAVATARGQGDSSVMNARFDHGIRFESDDGQFQMRIKARLHVDVMQAKGDSDLQAKVGRYDDGMEIRRARLDFDGRVSEHLAYLMQLEFAEQGVRMRTVLMSVADVYGVDRVGLGQFKEPMGQEQLGSSNNILSLERALTSALVPGRNIGIGLLDQPIEDRLGVALGVFQESNSVGVTIGDGRSVTGRMFGTPIRTDEGLLHLGVSASWRNPDEYLVTSRPESHQSPRLVDTGLLTGVDRVVLAGLEAVAIRGPVSVQSEYLHSWVDQASGASPDFHAWNVAAAWTVTGEPRRYRSLDGTLGAVRPARPLQKDAEGFGAVELRARYSHLDGNSEMVRGGILDDYTFGVNWYPNEWTRVMGEVVLADLEGVGQATIWQLRFQLAF